jgi:8-oxo-dGTP pyrophosphatase MutT (NUDIX family)
MKKRRVLKEIDEETGLPPEAVQFVRKGNPIRIEDGDTLWVVYPFPSLSERWLCGAR